MKESKFNVVFKKKLTVRLSGSLEELEKLDAEKIQQYRNLVDRELETKFLEEVEFDLSGLRSADDLTVAFLIGRYKKAHKSGIKLTISNPSKNVDGVLHAAGIYELIPKTGAVVTEKVDNTELGQ